MTSIPDSVKATLDAGWSAAGGAEPTYYVSEDFRTDPPLGKDGIWIPTGTLKTRIVPVNDTYANKLHTLDIIVNTQTDEDRLKEIADEIERILNTTAITGATYQKVIDRKNNTGEYNGIWVYQEIITVDMREQLATSASAYGAGTGPALTQAQLEDLLMYGSANAAWVSCPFELARYYTWAVMHVEGYIYNTGTSQPYIYYALPLPTTKGSLKLYISGSKIELLDADATNYIAATRVFGMIGTTSDIVDQDNTAKNTSGTKTDTFTAIDMSGYNITKVQLSCPVADANKLKIYGVSLQCYYDT